MEDREIIDLFFARNEEGILRLQEQYKAYCGKIASGVLSQKEDARGRNVRKAWKSLEKIFGFLLTT